MSDQGQTSLLNFLLWLMAFIVSVFVGTAIWVVEGEPAGWYQTIEGRFSNDGHSAFWYEKESNQLRVVGLQTNRDVLKHTLDARYLKWSADDGFLYFIQTDKFHYFCWLELSTGKVTRGPKADAYIAVSNEVPIYLLGDGDYLNDSPYQMRSYSIASGKVSDPIPIFNAEVVSHSSYSGGAISPDGTIVGIGRWGYNSPDGFEVWDVSTQKRLIKSEEEASFIYFSPDQTQVATVRSTASKVQLHRFDLQTGELIHSTDRFDGSGQADCSSDFKHLAIGRSSNRDNEDHIEMFSIDSLEKQTGARLPNERHVLDIDFTSDNKVQAIGRSGAIWSWDPTNHQSAPAVIGRIIRAMKDLRGLHCLWSGVPLLFLAFLATKQRKAISTQMLQPPVTKAVTVFGVICLVEMLSWVLILVVGFIDIFPLVLIHCFVSVVAIVYIVLAAIYRVKLRWRWTIASGLVLICGAVLKYLIVFEAIASV